MKQPMIKSNPASMFKLMSCNCDQARAMLSEKAVLLVQCQGSSRPDKKPIDVLQVAIEGENVLIEFMYKGISHE